MKKLFLLLILSFFSAQSFAGSCPDGSDPVKSISADGTYYVYNCAKSSQSSSSGSSSVTTNTGSNGEMVLADEAKEMFDDHVKQSDLLKVPLPSVNRVIKDYQRFEDYRKNYLANNYHYTNYLWKQEVNGQVLTKDVCMKIITEFRVPTTPTKEEFVFKRCGIAFMDNAVINFDDGIKLYEELILAIATAKPDNWIYKDSGVKDFNPRDYNVWGVLSPIVMFYAVYHDQFNYTDVERKVIENYFKAKAMKERLNRNGDGLTALCPITDPMKLSKSIHVGNNCGSVRFRFAPAELALGIIMQDQELWAKGLWDLDYTLSMIEKEGFFVPLSAKGCKALGYTWDTSKLLSLNVEMLKLADFNLLDYKTRHGKTVAEAYEMLFKQYEDITISNHIAEKGIGADSCGTKPYKTHEEFVFYQFVKGGDPELFADAVREGWVPDQEHFMNWSIRFVSEKHPEWLNGKYTLRDIKVHPWLGSYFHIQPFEIFNANVMSESDGIWQETSEQELADCKVSELNGEYIATWIIHVNNKEVPELRGSEKLTLDKCVGQFEGAEGFHPPNELVKEQRKNLQVTLKTNGQITISGHIDIFGSGRGYPTVLKGDINSGEISGIWQEGDLIKIEIISQKENKQKQIEASSELSIFESDGETFNIALDKVDFIETGSFELERSAEYLKPYQLHKAVIQGGLKTKSNGTKQFKTLVYKYAGTQEQKLVIHVDDSTIKPLKRHKDSLEKKCGSKVMEWGWLSFISKTNDSKSARNQQCIYDYFKQANDKQAWELFQAVLGGTDSILDYLETNVEP